MSTIEDRTSASSGVPRDGSVDMKLEVITIPVSDVERAMVAEQAGTELPQ